MCIVAPALFLLLSVGASPLFGQDMSGPLSPSDVHQHARWVMDEIRLIREHEGVTEEPRDPGTREPIELGDDRGSDVDEVEDRLKQLGYME